MKCGSAALHEGSRRQQWGSLLLKPWSRQAMPKAACSRAPSKHAPPLEKLSRANPMSTSPCLREEAVPCLLLFEALANPMSTSPYLREEEVPCLRKEAVGNQARARQQRGSLSARCKSLAWSSTKSCWRACLTCGKETPQSPWA